MSVTLRRCQGFALVTALGNSVMSRRAVAAPPITGSCLAHPPWHSRGSSAIPTGPAPRWTRYHLTLGWTFAPCSSPRLANEAHACSSVCFLTTFWSWQTNGRRWKWYWQIICFYWDELAFSLCNTQRDAAVPLCICFSISPSLCQSK